jgi:hypothetical protein
MRSTDGCVSCGSVQVWSVREEMPRCHVHTTQVMCCANEPARQHYGTGTSRRSTQRAKASALPSMPIECKNWSCYAHLRERQPDMVNGSESAISDSCFALAAGVAPKMSGRTDARRQALRREVSAMPHGPGRPDPLHRLRERVVKAVRMKRGAGQHQQPLTRTR